MAWIDRFVFYPDSTLIGTPSDVGLRYEEVRFSAADGTSLHGWFVPGTRPETILWFHGNAGNISHRLDLLRLLHDYVGTQIFLIDYRQYGRSEGTATESGLYQDARGALAYLQTRSTVASQRVLYFGQSLGSAVAIDLASSAPPLGLILEAPFTSLRDMASTILPGPLSGLVPNGFNNLEKIAAISSPKLFIHGDRDEIVPYAQGQRLYAAASSPKFFFSIPGASHNDTYVIAGTSYFDRLRSFIDDLARSSPHERANRTT